MESVLLRRQRLRKNINRIRTRGDVIKGISGAVERLGSRALAKLGAWAALSRLASSSAPRAEVMPLAHGTGHQPRAGSRGEAAARAASRHLLRKPLSLPVRKLGRLRARLPRAGVIVPASRGSVGEGWSRRRPRRLVLPRGATCARPRSKRPRPGPGTPFRRPSRSPGSLDAEHRGA